MITKCLKEKFKKSKIYLKSLIASARKITICVEGWTKKGLSSSFFGISACFFAPELEQPVHIVLELLEISHPHTGKMLSKALRKCFKRWGITATKVLMIVSDNGSNMIKTVRLLNKEDKDELESESNDKGDNDEQTDHEEDENMTMAEESDQDDEDSDNDVDTESNNAAVANLDSTLLAFKASTEYVRLQCLAHTLQLVVKKCYTGHYDTVLTKTRRLVSRFRKSAP